MKILVYDSRTAFLNFQCHRVVDYFQKYDTSVDLIHASCFEELTNELALGDCEIVFVNVDYDNGKGKDFIHHRDKLRKKYYFVFMSRSIQWFQSITEKDSFSFLFLPLQSFYLKQTLESILNWYVHQNIQFIIPTRDKQYKRVLHTDEIKYVETYYEDIRIKIDNDECLILHVKNRNLLRKILKPRGFMQINQSTLVNMKYIDFMTESHVILKSREIFPISKKVIHHCYDLYSSYLKRKGIYNENCNLSGT